MKNFISLLMLVSVSVFSMGYSFADDWVKCADENGYCKFSGRLKVRYGAGSQWHYLTLTDGTACDNSVFGDPSYGVVKRCYYYQVSPDVWEFCADENGYCRFQGAREIRYGVNGVYRYKVLEDGAYCNNYVFGDPMVGVPKKCDMRILN